MTAAMDRKLGSMTLEALVERRTDLSQQLDRVFADIALVSRGLSMRPGDAAARLASKKAAAGKEKAGKASRKSRKAALGIAKDLREAVRARLGQSSASVKEIAAAIAADGGAGDDGEILATLQKRVTNILVRWRKMGKAKAEGHARDWKWSLLPSGQEVA